MLHFLKEPRAAEAGTAYHDGVHTVEVEAFFGPLGSGDITVADDGNVHAWVLFHLADKCPVRLAGIHLARVRPWMVRAAMPQSCNCSARSTMILLLASQPGGSSR